MNCPACRAPNDDKLAACATCGTALLPSALPSLKPGSLIAARYEVLQVVGKGGMGVVVKARDRALDEIVALKVLRADLAESAEMDRRFRTEIKLARRVRHRNVCAIHEYGEDGPLRFISMEFIEGTDLRQILRETGGPLPHEAYEVAIQAGEGLVAIHEAGIIHRDLKTSNIMRDQRGFVRLMDFGIAKDSSSDMTSGGTGTGEVIGTPEYMSPEQIRGEKLDFRSDVYSLGVVIFELFTGRVPFHGDTPLATILKHLQEPAPLDGPEAARLPRELVPVLARTLAKDRTARQASVIELIEDLERVRGMSFPANAGTQPPGLPVTRPLSARRPQTGVSRVTAVPTVVPTVMIPRPERPATARAEPGPTSQRRVAAPAARAVAATSWAVWVAVPVLALAAAGGAFIAVRSQAPGSVNATVAPPPPTIAPPPTAPRASEAPATEPRASEAPAPVPGASEAQASAPPASTAPATALPRPTASARVPPSRVPSASPSDRSALERAAAAERVLSSARETLARAEAAPALEAYLEANRLFSQALDVDAGNREAREGLSRAIRGEERVRARLTQVSFEQSGTDVSGAPANDLPPGLAAPPGVAIKRAQPAGPRARIVIEVEPRLLKPGEEYVVRYFLQNESTGSLLIAGASIQNHIGASGVTGGKVEPATTTVAPRTRSLLFEARDVWRQELGTPWQTTLRVFLTDGSVYSSSLATRQ